MAEGDGDRRLPLRFVRGLRAGRDDRALEGLSPLDAFGDADAREGGTLRDEPGREGDDIGVARRAGNAHRDARELRLEALEAEALRAPANASERRRLLDAKLGSRDADPWRDDLEGRAVA